MGRSIRVCRRREGKSGRQERDEVAVALLDEQEVETTLGAEAGGYATYERVPRSRQQHMEERSQQDRQGRDRQVEDRASPAEPLVRGNNQFPDER